MSATTFRLFWENSTLGPRTARGFAAELDEDARTPRPVAQLFHPAADTPLGAPAPVAAPLAALFAARRSRRAFGDRPLGREELSTLCLGLAARPDGSGRAAPSAGANYAVETFVLLWRADHPLAGRAVYYTPDSHALVDIAPAPPFDPARFGLEPDTGTPAAALLFVGLPERVTSRYDERGGRFLLLEAGHLAQNVLLAATALDLAAVPLGGTWDRPLLGALALDETRFALTYAIALGPPAPDNSR